MCPQVDHLSYFLMILTGLHDLLVELQKGRNQPIKNQDDVNIPSSVGIAGSTCGWVGGAGGSPSSLQNDIMDNELSILLFILVISIILFDLPPHCCPKKEVKQ